MKNQYRIGEETLLKLDYGLSERKHFFQYNQNGNSQYVLGQPELLFNNSNNINEIIEKTVWNDTNQLNKVFNSLPLLDNINDFDGIFNERIITGTILLKQGFSWNNVFGVLVVIKTMGNQFTEKILLSQLFNIDNFKFNFDDSKELINGSFWTKNINFCIPNFNEQLMISIETIMFTDVVYDGIDIGKINNYPVSIDNYEPLVGEEPIPANIQTEVIIENNQYLSITPITLEPNKTLEKTIYEFFGLNENNIIPITIEHIVKYGNDNFGYKTIKISNEDYKYGKIKIGLDLTEFDSTEITIFVSTEINCNNKLIKREQTIIFDYADILNPVISNLVLSPASIFPVEVKNIQNINNTVIESKIESKIIAVYQPTFVELQINDVILFESKNISFNDITIPSYLVTKTSEGNDKDFILSKSTIEGKIYYDLSTITKPEKDINYQIIDAETKLILKKGIIKI